MPDFDMVVYRLEEAGCTRMALDAQARGADAARPTPGHLYASRRVLRMEEAFGWVVLIPRERASLRRVVRARALVSPSSERHVHPWSAVARLLGCSEDEAREMHREGIELIVAVLRALGRPGGSGHAADR